MFDVHLSKQLPIGGVPCQMAYQLGVDGKILSHTKNCRFVTKILTTQVDSV
jgi:hypothetical protein